MEGEKLERFHDWGGAPDKVFVGTFLQHAEEIFTAAREGSEDCELAILVGRDGGIHMLAAADWGLEPLRLHHGAQTAYRISRGGGRVRLEARSGMQTCLLEAAPRRRVSAQLADFPQYLRME
jgi:hypothetical protein